MKKTTAYRVEAPDFHNPITVRELWEFLSDLAERYPDAEVEPVLGEKGGQRDPIQFLRGALVRIVDET